MRGPRGRGVVRLANDRFRRLAGSTLLCVASIGVAAGAAAAPFFSASPAGDWLDGASWSSGSAPTAADDAVVDNGGTVTGSSAAPATLEAGSLAVGSRLDASRPAAPLGRLDLEGFDLAVGGDLAIAVIDFDPDERSAAQGDVALAGAGAGNLRVGGAARVAVVEPGPDGHSQAAGSSAQGSLRLAGLLEATGSLEIGVERNHGHAEGSVSVDALRLHAVEREGGGSGLATITVGARSRSGPFEPADAHAQGGLSVAGDLEVVYDGPRWSELFVGHNAGEGEALGSVSVGGDLLGVRRIAVGVAVPQGGHPKAWGSLSVAGTLEGDTVNVNDLATLEVGMTYPGFGGSGEAEGRVEVGAIGARLVDVGVAYSGSAQGELVIGSGDVSATVGLTSGSDADAEGLLVTRGGVFVATVGKSEGGGFRVGGEITPFSTGNARGTVLAEGFAGGVQVGIVNSDGSARGHVEVAGVAPGGASRPAPVRVGANERGAGRADAVMFVGAGGIEASSIRVGVLGAYESFFPFPLPPAAGTVDALLESRGDVWSLGTVGGDRIGAADARATGSVSALWVHHEGRYSGGRMTVGLSEGAASAQGTWHLDRTLATLDDLILGDGATLILEMRGLLRGLEYAALDAAQVALDGTLHVFFPDPLPNGIYDLIVSDAPDGITGDFASVIVDGLAPEQNARHGVEIAEVGGAPVEIYRLRIVPEPASAALLALGLAGLAVPRRR